MKDNLKKKTLYIFLLCESLCFIYILLYGEYVSDYLNIKTTLSETIIVTTFLFLMALYLTYHLVWSASEKIFYSGRVIGTAGNLNGVMFVLIILYFILVFKTGVGKVGASDAVSLTFTEKLIFLPPILFKANFLIYIYAAGNRFRSKLYYCNLFVFLAAEISRGVSFSILLLLLIEYDNIKKYISFKYILISILMSVVLVNLIYNVKFYIRMGGGYNYIGVYESLIMLFGRLSIISNFLYIQEHIDSLRIFMNASGYTGLANEFLESLTPMPSLFGINDKVVEFGKFLFSYSNVTLNSATAASLIGILYILPKEIGPAIIIFTCSGIFVQYLLNKINANNHQQLVAYFFFLLTLYQGFMAILSNYIYALIVYVIFISLRNILLKANKYEKVQNKSSLID